MSYFTNTLNTIFITYSLSKLSLLIETDLFIAKGVITAATEINVFIVMDKCYSSSIKLLSIILFPPKYYCIIYKLFLSEKKP